MKIFTTDLLDKKIVMLSDYVNPDTYSPKELEEENLFIKTLREELASYKVDFHYLEVKDHQDLVQNLKNYDPQNSVIFNWCEYLEEQENTAHLITSYLETNNFIFTGADTQVLKLSGSKQKTKERLIANNLPTPKYMVIKSTSDLNKFSLPFPVMLKLEDRHASAGITNENVVYNREQLSKVVSRLLTEFNTGILAEEFIDGAEYTATVWGNGEHTSCIYLTKETYADSNVSNIFTEKGKFEYGSPDEQNVISVELKDTKVISKISDISVNSFKALGFKDYGRFELREKNGALYVIDCNPNQWLGMDCVLFKGTKKLGYNYGETLLQICEFAVKRYI